MKTKNLFFIFLFFMLSHGSTSANIITGDIYYSHLSGLTYKINIELYTTLPAIDTIILLNKGDGISDTLIGLPQSFDNFALITYSIDHTYTGQGTYILSINIPNRIPDILNMANSFETEFYLQCKLIIDSTFINNSSIKTSLPIDTAYLGKNYQYNMNLTDNDNDSLIYSLLPPAGIGSFIPSGMVIDSLLGTIVWNTPLALGEWIVDILIKEKRNGAITGESIKELYIYVAMPPQSVKENNLTDSRIITIFPNPVSHFITFQMQLNERQDIRYSVFNLHGQLIEEKKLGKKSGNISHTLDCSYYPNGIYLLKINCGNNVINYKIVKQF